MIPRRPSLPSTISRTLGPVEVLGTGRVASIPFGVATRRARVRSATSPYLSDCMPEERVAIQPPRVEWVKLSGKWPSVQPRAFSCSSRWGPNTPGCTRASRARSSSASTRSMRVRSTEITGRVSAAGASRLPEMFVPPPKGITTASASSAARRTASTSSSEPGRTTASGRGPTSPRRCRTRSRRLLPRACTIRSRSSRRPLRPHRLFQRGPQAGRQRRLGQLEILQTDRVGGRPLHVEVEGLLDEGGQLRLVLVR